MLKHLRIVLRYAFLVCAAFTVTTTAAAQEEGVLLAVAGRTYWIVHTPGEAHIASTLTDIVVPHGNGFWRVGTIRVCEFDGINNDHREIAYQAPLASEPVVYQRAECVWHENVQDNAQDCGIEEAGIVYVSPLIVSETYTQRETEECDPRGGRDRSLARVHRLGETEPISVSQVVPSVSQQQFGKALQEAYEEIKAEGMNCPEPPGESEMDLKNFFVRHEKGAWYGVAELAGLGYWSDCQVSRAIADVLPHSVTYENSSEDLFSSISKCSPEVVDLFAAPDGTWAVAITKQTKAFTWTISVFELDGKRLGTKLLDVVPPTPDPNISIVETQWAMGKHVAEWTAALAAAGRSGLPEPKVIVSPKRARSPYDLNLSPKPSQ